MAAACLAAACARPGSETLTGFKDPQGQFEAFFPAAWTLDGNYAQEKPISAVRWVMAYGQVKAQDEGLPLGVVFKISRFPLEKIGFPGNAAAFTRYKNSLLQPRLDAIAQGQASRTSHYTHANPTHGVGPIDMTARSVVLRTPRAVYELELVAVKELFPAYEPLFDRALSRFSVLEK